VCAATRASASQRSISRSVPDISAACRARSDASRETVFSKLLYRLSSVATGRIGRRRGWRRECRGRVQRGEKIILQEPTE
jgi:hypothetical protein